MQAGFLKKEAVVAAIPAEALEAKFELCLTACAALRSKPADEEEPYVFRYEERDALQQLLKQAAANAAVEPEGADAARARVIGGVLECWLGVNFMDTEEPGSGQARLERAIEALDTEVAPAEAVRLLDALNHLGVLWANRGESEKSLERLEAAEVLHKSLRSGSGVTELREGEEQLEDLHTLTCFYLAQACLTASHLTALPYLTLPYLTVHRTPPHLTPPHPTSPHLTPPHPTSPPLTSPPVLLPGTGPRQPRRAGPLRRLLPHHHDATARAPRRQRPRRARLPGWRVGEERAADRRLLRIGCVT